MTNVEAKAVAEVENVIFLLANLPFFAAVR